MRKLTSICLVCTLIATACADKGNRKIAENAPVNVGIITATPMSSQYYNVYIGEINASGSAVISSNHPGTLDVINVKQGHDCI